MRCITLELIRRESPDAIARFVADASNGLVVVADSIDPRDMQVVTLGLLKAELMRGAKRPLLYRSAGAFGFRSRSDSCSPALDVVGAVCGQKKGLLAPMSGNPLSSWQFYEKSAPGLLQLSLMSQLSLRTKMPQK